jgi:hypothetical protein
MNIREMSLMNLVVEISKTNNQEIKNLLALELTYRTYIPFKDKTFEEMLVENGYRIIEKDKNKNTTL